MRSAQPVTDPELDLGALGLDAGGQLLLARALRPLPAGARLRVRGSDPHLALHLRVWARTNGHAIANLGDVDPAGEKSAGACFVVVRGDLGERRLAGAERAGLSAAAPIRGKAPASWGLAARGALVEAGGSELRLADLDEREVVWSDLAPKLYAQAVASQWDPATAVDWTPPQLPLEIEDAVVQVMTYLVENEQAALMVPARFLGRIHPHFREAAQFLATQVADEARHVEVFARRAGITGRPLGVSGAGGRASLQTLFEEPDFASASFLLSALGEGSFLALLGFLTRVAPDPVTARVAGLAQQDEARHVAYALGHLCEHVTADSRVRDRLRAAAERRHAALASTAGLSPAVRDAFVVLAAGSFAPDAIAAGWSAVQQLQAEMDEGRRRRLVRLGFSDAEATELSALHTRNFM